MQPEKAEIMGEINSQKAFSEINFDEDALENMSPRLRDEIQTDIQSYMHSLATKINEYQVRMEENPLPPRKNIQDCLLMKDPKL